MRLSLLIIPFFNVIAFSIPANSQNVGIGVTNPLQKLHVGGSVRVDGLAVAGSGIITTNTNGDLLRTNFSGNANDVLRGNGTFGAAPSTLPVGSIVASNNSNDQNLLSAGFSFYGELSLPAISYYPMDAGLSQQFTQAPTYETGNPLKTQALSARGGHSSVWTGTEMLTWGGYSIANGIQYNFHSNGARYNPSTDVWTNMSDINAQLKSAYHSSVWTGSEMIVWGGLDSISGDFFGNGSRFFHNTGKRYNPVTNTWTNMSVAGAPTARYRAPAVWTGTYMVVWGGGDGTNAISDGARYNPTTNTWLPVNTLNAPIADGYDTKMFWTGTYIIVLGVNDTVARYNPSTNAWLISAKYPPGTIFRKNTAVWTGTELWAYEAGFKRIHKYNPVTNVWSNITVVGSIFPETSFQVEASIWSDTELILFGSVFDANGVFQSNRCYNYNPGTNTFHTNIGTIRYGQRVAEDMTFMKAGSIVIKWGGYFSDFSPDVLANRYSRQGVRIYLTSGVNIPTVYLRSTYGNTLYLYRKE